MLILFAVAGQVAMCMRASSEEPHAGTASSLAAAPSEANAAVEPVPVARLLALARQQNATRAMLDANRAMAEAAIVAARAWANPTLELEGGQARIRDSSDRILTSRAALTQLLEWPGRRDRRMGAAQAGIAIASGEAALLILDLEGDVRQAAIELAAAEADLQQAQRSAELARRVLEATDHRIAAGEADHGDHLRAELDERQARVAVNQHRQTIMAHRAALRLLCGAGLPDAMTVPDAWSADAAPTLAQAQAAIDRHPALQRLRSQRQQQLEAMYGEELAGRPDFAVGAFAGHGADANEVGLTLGISLPLWSRNQGGVALARAELQRTDAQIAVETLTLTRAVTAAWYAEAAARERREQLIREVEPLAEATIDLRLRAFTAGEVGLADVLDAKRTAAALMETITVARAEAASAWVRLIAAMGGAEPGTSIPAVEKAR